jgi:hypothetical protein
MQRVGEWRPCSNTTTEGAGAPVREDDEIAREGKHKKYPMRRCPILMDVVQLSWLHPLIPLPLLSASCSCDGATSSCSDVRDDTPSPGESPTDPVGAPPSPLPAPLPIFAAAKQQCIATGPCEGVGAPWPGQLLWRRWMEESKWRCRSSVQGEGNPSGGVGALGMDLRAGRPGPGCKGEVRRIRGGRVHMIRTAAPGSDRWTAASGFNSWTAARTCWFSCGETGRSSLECSILGEIDDDVLDGRYDGGARRARRGGRVVRERGGAEGAGRSEGTKL